MNRIKQFIKKYSNHTLTAVAALVLTIGVSSASAACFLWYHQPKMPASIRGYQR